MSQDQPRTTPGSMTPADTRRALAALGREFHQRGWATGTSGNFSAVLSFDPLTVVITPSGADKGRLRADDMLTISETGMVLDGGPGRPSEETPLHLTLIERRGAGSVLHTHSVWSTLVSARHAACGEVMLTGFEMLKGLAGVTTHEHEEFVPILANSQSMETLVSRLGDALERRGECHGVLIEGHGLTTWGRDLDEARRHVEVLEFLLEVVGRADAVR